MGSIENIDKAVASRNLINVKNLSFTYQGMEAPALKNINMVVQEGQCVLLCGKSGCGKTTMTRVLNGLVPAFFKGELTGMCNVCGLECGSAAVEDFVPVVGSVFQNPKTQYFNTNTTAELAFPCENVGMAPDEIEDRVKKCAKKYGLEKLIDRSIFRLSGGEKQRIAFGAATMLSPKLLVLDEPTSNLDADAINALHDMIIEMKGEGMTIVLAEHRLAWAGDFVDRYYFFEEGLLKESYSAKEFTAQSDEELEKRGLRAARLEPYRVQVEGKLCGRLSGDSAVEEYGSGKEQCVEGEQQCKVDEAIDGNVVIVGNIATVENITTERNIATVENAGEHLEELRLSNVTIGYNRKSPVYTVREMCFKSGEIVGIMGHNGVGKSTLIRTMTGLIKPLSGDIMWNGRRQRAKELKKRSFLVMQDVNYQLFSDSVRDEVMLDTEDEKACGQVLEGLGLMQYADRHPMSLSGGQKQRTAIASAMVSDKRIIVMDEPTSGLDRYHMKQVGELIQGLKNQGKLVVVITHDEELAAGWCDRIYKLE